MNILIYCNNSEHPLFSDRVNELIRSGLQSKFREVKYKGFELCDIVITLPRHEQTVREIFRNHPRVKIEVYDGSKKGTKVVAPFSAKEVNNGEESKVGNGQVGEESRKAGGVQGQGRQVRAGQEVSGEEKVIIPVTRNANPKNP